MKKPEGRGRIFTVTESESSPERRQTKTVNAKSTEIRRSMETFKGFILGIVSNQEVTSSELEKLRDWIDSHSAMRNIYPISEALELADRILLDKKVDDDETEEFLDFADRVLRFTKSGDDIVTAEITELHGFLAGIVSDARIDEQELLGLRRWMEAHQGARDKWPYDETLQLIEKILEDGVVTSAEQSEFMAFASQFVERLSDDQALDASYFRDRWMQSEAPVVNSVDGLYHPDGVASVRGARVCFTGQMASGTRKEVEAMADKAGAIPSSITKQLDYLVIGSRSNPSWAYATYGRKVEKVMDYNKKGSEIRIVSEDQFLRALGQ